MTTTDAREAPEAVAAPTTRRWVRPAAAGATLLAVLALFGAVGGWAAHRHHAGGAAPYTDPAATGRITLCRHGKPVTSGSISDQPFADAIVGGQAASGAYAAGGRSATLFAYQPRAGIEPAAWSGLQLGAPTAYSDVSAPTAAATRADTTLAQFVTAFPAVDAGWVQLRLVLGAPGVAPDTAAYASADLHISGNRWTLADPGEATCPATTTPTP